MAVNAAYEKAAAAGRSLSIDELAEALREQGGYDVRIRTALGGGGGGDCLRNLRHQFLTLNMTGRHQLWPYQQLHAQRIVCELLLDSEEAGQHYKLRK